MIERQVTTITVDADEDFEPPLVLDVPSLRRVSEEEAAVHPRPHLVTIRGGRHDGHVEWWVSDEPCGCEGHD